MMPATDAVARGLISAAFLPYLPQIGHPLAIVAGVYYGVKAMILLLAGVVGVCTKDEGRREACLKLAGIVCRGWRRSPPQPTSGND
jgi:hypothetical protein